MGLFRNYCARDSIAFGRLGRLCTTARSSKPTGSSTSPCIHLCLFSHALEAPREWLLEFTAVVFNGPEVLPGATRSRNP